VLVTLLLALAAGLSVTIWNNEPGVIIPKSVAVLPFENLSGDPGNAYLAEGVQEEILTRLASIAGLKVISRASTQHYQNKPRNLGEIAKQLGVANILEGSVQKTADQVRVNVQLINAQSDSHLWADTYDRKLTDILGVESEIAKRIAESLQAKLTSYEEQALAVRPTNKPEAYDAYLRGLACDARGSDAPDALVKGAVFYDRAVQLDPNFAIAWARLSRAHGFLSLDVEPTAARRDAAKRALESAQKLEPNLAETSLALGYYQYWVLRDYGAAKTTLGRVSRLLPGSSEAAFALGLVSRRDGHWDESVAYLEQALNLDPRNVRLLSVAAENYAVLRQFPAALKLYDRMLDITPNDPGVIAQKASIFQAQGDLPEASKLLADINAQTNSGTAFEIKINQLRLERNYGEAVRLLQARLAQFHFGLEWYKKAYQGDLALMQRLAGDLAGAKVTGKQLRITTDTSFDDPTAMGLLAQAYAGMGENDSALKAAERAVTLMPRAKDAFVGPVYEENLAFIEAMFGENRHAISTLTQLLQTPYIGLYQMPITSALLKLDPLWDPLRSDPVFQKLCEEKPK
jgi:TolB-like protein/cytochrome c-type biogenesis protein CcmH/NrfG